MPDARDIDRHLQINSELGNEDLNDQSTLGRIVRDLVDRRILRDAIKDHTRRRRSQVENELVSRTLVRVLLHELFFLVLNSLRVVTVLGLPVTDTNVVHGVSSQIGQTTNTACYKSIIAY